MSKLPDNTFCCTDVLDGVNGSCQNTANHNQNTALSKSKMMGSTPLTNLDFQENTCIECR